MMKTCGLCGNKYSGQECMNPAHLTRAVCTKVHNVVCRNFRQCGNRVQTVEHKPVVCEACQQQQNAADVAGQ